MPNVLMRDLDGEVLKQLKAAAKRDSPVVIAVAEALEPFWAFGQR